MQLVFNENEPFAHLTKGKVYQINQIPQSYKYNTENTVGVVCDDGVTRYVNEINFTTLQEYRDKLIDELLS